MHLQLILLSQDTMSEGSKSEGKRGRKGRGKDKSLQEK